MRLLAGDSLLLACLGEKDESGQVYLLYKSFSPGAAKPGSNIGYLDHQIWLSQGRKEEVLASISEAFRARQNNWDIVHANARFCPWYDLLRGDPRFEKLLRDNMPKYAKQFGEPTVK